MAEFDMENIEEMLLTLENEDGTTTDCQILQVFEYKGREYAAAAPTNENNEEIYFFGWEAETNGEEVEISLENLEDEELLQELFDVFIESWEDEEELEEDEDSKWDEFINKKLED